MWPLEWVGGRVESGEKIGEISDIGGTKVRSKEPECYAWFVFSFIFWLLGGESVMVEAFSGLSLH